MRAAELFEYTPEKGWIRTPVSMEQAMKTIQSECKQAYQVFEDTGLRAYRGIEIETYESFLGKTGRDRLPMNSTPEFQQLIDQALRDHLGSDAAVRSNSIFVTGSSSHARGYGDAYVIFPKDSARFTWSTEYDDIVIDSSMRKWTDFVPLTQLLSYQKFLDYLEDYPELNQNSAVVAFLHYFDTNTDYLIWWQDNPISKLSRMPEPVRAAAKISGFDKFLDTMSNASYGAIKKLYDQDLAKFNAKDFIEDFKPRDTDWAAALKSKNEILVSGEYVAILATEFIKYLHPIR